MALASTRGGVRLYNVFLSENRGLSTLGSVSDAISLRLPSGTMGLSFHDLFTLNTPVNLFT